MTMWFKKKEVPETNETKVIDVVQAWEVRWESRHGSFNGQTNPEVEVFLSEAAANEFAQSLRNAFKLIKHTSGATVTVKKGS